MTVSRDYIYIDRNSVNAEGNIRSEFQKEIIKNVKAYFRAITVHPSNLIPPNS